jgi:hypothetical protein
MLADARVCALAMSSEESDSTRTGGGRSNGRLRKTQQNNENSRISNHAALALLFSASGKPELCEVGRRERREHPQRGLCERLG